jgi:dienelactone hydrolase
MLSVVAASPAQTLQTEQVEITSGLRAHGAFTALLAKPAGRGPFPAVVALHGCGGLIAKDGRVAARETDWGERLVAAGYAVLFPDSFTARGIRQICTVHDRSITPEDRALDARAAADWLRRQPFIDPARIGLMGWSHGAMTVLWTVRPGFLADEPQFKVAIGLYPGCREIARQADWRPAIPLTVLVGSADDWTQPGPCRELAVRTGFRIIEYAGAYHGFDAPNSPVRVRRNLGAVRSGEAHVGTDPAARAAAIDEIMGLLSRTLVNH